MKLTKYAHACFTLEKEGKVLIVDPGGFSDDFVIPENVVAIVITHQHPDHFDQSRIAEIVSKNDQALVLGPADVIDQAEIENKQVVQPGDRITVGPFNLEFFGGTHALIHESLPRIQNIGVLINELVYYPGDSFEIPHKPIDVLAIPATAPWMKIGEAMDFLTAIKPRLVFPTHDAIASGKGKALVDRMLGGVASENNIDYVRLASPIEI